MIDRRQADGGIVAAAGERQVARIAHLRVGPIRDAGYARVYHEALRRVVVDPVIAFVNVHSGDGRARFCQEHAYRRASRPGSDVHDPAGSGRKKPRSRNVERKI
jgi:hypothetical protein